MPGWATRCSTGRSGPVSKWRANGWGAREAMAELTFDPQTIVEALRKVVETYKPSVEREEVGRVHEAGAGIAVVLGLPRTMANELLAFPGGKLGLASNLDEDRIGCVILDEEFAD